MLKKPGFRANIFDKHSSFFEWIYLILIIDSIGRYQCQAFFLDEEKYEQHRVCFKINSRLSLIIKYAIVGAIIKVNFHIPKFSVTNFILR